MYCENCGTGLSGQETVCPYCGIALRPIIPAYNPFPPPAVNQTAMPGNNAIPATAPATNPAVGADGATDTKTSEKTTDALNETAPSDAQKIQGQNDAPAPQQPQSAWQQRPLFPNEQRPNNPQAGFCTRCGQKLQPGETKCTFCGQPVSAMPFQTPYFPQPGPYVPGQTPYPYYPYPAQPQQPVKKQGTALGIVALVGALLFPYGYFYMWIVSVIAIVLGARSKNTAAIVLGIISCCLCLFTFFILFLMIDNPEYFYESYTSFG